MDKQRLESLDLLLTSVGIGYWELDFATGAYFASDNLLAMTGFHYGDEGDLMDFRAKMVLPEDLERVNAEYEKLFTGGADSIDIVYKLARKDREPIWVREDCVVVSRSPDGNPTRLMGMVYDIDEVKAAEARQKAEAEYREYVAHLAGLGSWEWHADTNQVTFNNDYRNLLDYDPAEMNGQLDDVCKWLVHPDDRGPFTQAFQKYVLQPDGVMTHQFRLRHRDGHYLWLLCAASAPEVDKDGRATLLRGGVLDVDKRVNTERALQVEVEKSIKELTGKDRLLETLNHVATSLTQASPEGFGRAVWEALRTVGTTVDADRMYIWENWEKDGKMFCTQTYEWSESAEPQQGKDFTLSLAYDDIPMWKECILSGRSINTLVENMPAAERAVLEPQGILSILIIPIYFEDKSWGYIGFDDCHRRRIFTPDEESVLQAGGISIASAIQRNDNTQQLIYQESLLRLFNKVVTGLLTVQPEDFLATLESYMGEVAHSVGADRMRIWENFDQNGKLFCRQLYEWSGEAAPQQGKDFTLSTEYAVSIPNWEAILRADKTINGPVRDLPIKERLLLASQGIESVLVLPIHIEGKFWGYIGFDDCHRERTFSELEQGVLRTGSSSIVSAIARNRSTEKLLQMRDELIERDKMLQAVNEAATLLMAGTDGPYEKVTLGALEILGQSIGVDRAYLWRNSLVDGKLCCSELAEWNNGQPSKHDEPPQNIPYEAVFPNFEELMNDQDSINGLAVHLEDALSSFPGADDVISLLVLPLVIGGEFWGFIGFDDISRERSFTSAQEDILRSGGMLIASGVLRNEVNENLVIAREDALACMNAKTEFLSRMSHEIRTPMNAIIGMTTIAKKTNDPDKIAECLRKVDSSSRQLLSLINDILDMSKIESGKLEINRTEFDFERMMENVFNVIQIKLEEKHLEFHYDFKSVFTRNMVADELRLSQVLINLLGNATKFTPDYGTITLRVRDLPGKTADTSTLHVEVVDNGIGITEEGQSHLFQSFEQADGGITRQYGGTGLGLAISKRIVELMDGEIRVESEHGQGSNFIFDVQVGWGEKVSHSLTERALNKDLRVLVVDDTPDVLEYFTNIFATFQLRCDTASNGYDAVEMVRKELEGEHPYDLVFIDWNMPGLNGGEAAAEIRRITEDHIIVVMISVSDWGDIEGDAKDFDVPHFLTKPILPSALYDTIVRLTNKSLVTEKTDAYPESPHWKGKRLLLVEDIEINREIVAGILEETDITIDTAENGQEAIDIFTKDPDRYDLILMDVQMPVLDGIAATRQIRALDIPRARTIPIIAMTANAFKEDEQACLDAGMDRHVAKPIEVDELYQTLNEYLGGEAENEK